MKRRTFLQSVAVAGVTAGTTIRALGSKPKQEVPPSDWEWRVTEWRPDRDFGGRMRLWITVATGSPGGLMDIHDAWNRCRYGRDGRRATYTTYNSKRFIDIPPLRGELWFPEIIKMDGVFSLGIMVVERLNMSPQIVDNRTQKPVLETCNKVDIHEVLRGTHSARKWT